MPAIPSRAAATIESSAETPIPQAQPTLQRPLACRFGTSVNPGSSWPLKWTLPGCKPPRSSRQRRPALLSPVDLSRKCRELAMCARIDWQQRALLRWQNWHMLSRQISRRHWASRPRPPASSSPPRGCSCRCDSHTKFRRGEAFRTEPLQVVRRYREMLRPYPKRWPVSARHFMTAKSSAAESTLIRSMSAVGFNWCK